MAKAFLSHRGDVAPDDLRPRRDINPDLQQVPRASTSTRFASTEVKPHKLNQDFPDYPSPPPPPAEFWPDLSSIPKTTAPTDQEPGVCQENKMIPHFSLEPGDEYGQDGDGEGAGQVRSGEGTSVWFIARALAWAGAHGGLMESGQQAPKVTVCAEDVALAWSLQRGVLLEGLPTASKEAGSPFQFISDSRH